jgi:hypothetical protein
MDTEVKNKKIFEKFIDIIKINELYNTTFAHHISYVRLNTDTGLEDEFEYYDYVYYDICVEEELKKALTICKLGNLINKLYKRKHIMKQIIENRIGDIHYELFKRGRFNYSTQFIKNPKIIPLEFNRNNTIIFSSK